MSDPDRLRRAATALAVTAALLLVPAVATAKFTDVEQPSLSVSTARMATPGSIAGSYSCSKNGSIESVQVTVTGFADAGPAGSTYVYRLTGDTGVATPVTTTAHSATILASQPDNNKITTWTLTIQSVRSSWTGTPSSTPLVCDKKSRTDGTFP